MELTAGKVHEIMMDCLFKEGEDTGGYVPAEGVMMKIGFHPLRLEAHREDVTAITQNFEPDFYPDTGGGMSFLRMCQTRNGVQWGEHKNCDEILCLSLALGLASYNLPREMWGVLPGGMPYVSFKKKI